MRTIPMIDLQAQYLTLKEKLDNAVADCFSSGQLIGGNEVVLFEKNLSKYIGVQHCVSCGNGTDALQIALMALDLPKGSKIIVPAFTYIAPVEVIKFLGYELIFADIDTITFNLTLENIQKVYTKDIKAIIAVHLFGQLCDIDNIYTFCKENNISLIEDYAQSIGAENNITRDSIITTSFFPTKNLGAYGDGGAVLCNNTTLAEKIRKIANHGQSKKYYHELVGINSRLDAVQAAILNVKLPYLNEYNTKRQQNATFYKEHLNGIELLELPSSIQPHIYHVYTVLVKNGLRDALKKYLEEKHIQSIINYPLPTYKQEAFYVKELYLENTETLCNSCLSLPIYPEITSEQLLYICDTIKAFFHRYE